MSTQRLPSDTTSYLRCRRCALPLPLSLSLPAVRLRACTLTWRDLPPRPRRAIGATLHGREPLLGGPRRAHRREGGCAAIGCAGALPDDDAIHSITAP